MRAFPFRHHSLCFGYLSGSHFSFGIWKIRFGRRELEPHVSPNIIPRHAFAIEVKEAQIVSALTGAAEVRDVLRCRSIPFGSLPVIPPDAFSVLIHLS